MDREAEHHRLVLPDERGEIDRRARGVFGDTDPRGSFGWGLSVRADCLFHHAKVRLFSVHLYAAGTIRGCRRWVDLWSRGRLPGT
jgi:hypothetical protein